MKTHFNAIQKLAFLRVTRAHPNAHDSTLMGDLNAHVGTPNKS